MSNGLERVTLEQLPEVIGKEFGPTEWIEITQDMVNGFAELTKDHQFIHVDEAAAAQTPFGGTIVHGFYTLSMVAYFLGQTGVEIDGIEMGLNYGLNKVRFLMPLRVGRRIRARIKPLSYTEKRPGELLACNEITVEIEGEEKPALIAEMLSLLVVKRAET